MQVARPIRKLPFRTPPFGRTDGFLRVAPVARVGARPFRGAFPPSRPARPGVLVPGALSRPPVGIGGKLKGEAGIQGPDTSAPATNLLRPSGGCRSAKAVD